jgi:hypothetical protein
VDGDPARPDDAVLMQGTLRALPAQIALHPEPAA